MTGTLQYQNWLIQPSTKLETIILSQPDLIRGLEWAWPTYGHPEASVALHVRDVLLNIDQLVLSPDDKIRLRLAAITHDSFKYKEFKLQKNNKHGKLARNFLAQYSDDQVLLDLLEWHDEAYHAWVLAFNHHNMVLAQKKITHLLEAFGKNIKLYQQFFICDSATGDKKKAPVHWFAEVLKKEGFFFL